MAAPTKFNVREIRYVDHSSTFPTAFTDGDNATWTNATKLRAYDIDFGDLKYAVEKDNTVQTREAGRPAPIETLTGGIDEQTLKFKMHLEGGASDTTAGTVITLISKCLGGLKSPTAATDAVEAASTTTTINATSHGQVVGQAMLFGVRGDARAEGRVGVLKTVDSANAYSLMMALPAAPTETLPDVIKNGHTAYVDLTAEHYLSFYLIGDYAGSGAADDSDQLNVIGCSGSFTLGGLGANELPFVEFAWRVGAWRNEPYASEATIDRTTAGSGGDPAIDRGIGILTIGDASATTRTTVAGSEVTFDPGIVVLPKRDPNGINGVGGWKRTLNDDGPMIEVTRYWGDMPGLMNDMTGGTAKQLLVACGHAAQGTFAIEAQRAFLHGSPDRAELEQSLATKLVFHADEGQATTTATDDLKLQDSSVRLTAL